MKLLPEKILETLSRGVSVAIVGESDAGKTFFVQNEPSPIVGETEDLR